MEQGNESVPKRNSNVYNEEETIEVNKTATEEMKQSEKADKGCGENHPEQKILIMACLNPEVSEKIIKTAKEDNMEIVLLDEKVIWDYIEMNKTTTIGDSLNSFLSVAENRLKAKEHAVHLWQILTKGDDFSNAENRVFKRTDITHNTNLSHRKASDLLQLLFAFGYIEYVNKDFEFKFIFDEVIQRKTLQAGIQAVCNVVSSDLAKYKNIVEQSETMSNEQKQEEIDSIKEKIRKQIGI
jgi:hypothetical protein